jgi:hypothetical protein
MRHSYTALLQLANDSHNGLNDLNGDSLNLGDLIGSNVWQDEGISYKIWREFRNCEWIQICIKMQFVYLKLMGFSTISKLLLTNFEPLSYIVATHLTQVIRY